MHPKTLRRYQMFTRAQAADATLSDEQISTGGHMPQIIVIADRPAEDGEAPVMFRERVSVSDFDSPHFATHLIERLGWAVGDADERDRQLARGGERRSSQRRFPARVERRGEPAGVSADRVAPVS
jgi:hypothetical protein